ISRHVLLHFFFFNDTATTEIYTLSLHDALPIWIRMAQLSRSTPRVRGAVSSLDCTFGTGGLARADLPRCRLRHGAQLLLANDLPRRGWACDRYRRSLAGRSETNAGAVFEHAD